MRQDLYQHTLNLLRVGQTLDDLSEALHDCIERSKETGKMSTLTLNLKIKPQGGGSQVFISDEIRTKLPEFPKEETLLFTTEEGDLQRNDPRQKQMPGLIDVNQIDQEPKKIKEAK